MQKFFVRIEVYTSALSFSIAVDADLKLPYFSKRGSKLDLDRWWTKIDWRRGLTESGLLMDRCSERRRKSKVAAYSKTRKSNRMPKLWEKARIISITPAWHYFEWLWEVEWLRGRLPKSTTVSRHYERFNLSFRTHRRLRKLEPYLVRRRFKAAWEHKFGSANYR